VSRLHYRPVKRERARPPIAVEGICANIWIIDAHGNGKRFIVRADEKLTAFVERDADST
jgi:hypothetical protein